MQAAQESRIAEADKSGGIGKAAAEAVDQICRIVDGFSLKWDKLSFKVEKKVK